MSEEEDRARDATYRKWVRRGFFGFVGLFLLFLIIPLIYVEFTVPPEFRRADPDSVLGRNSRVSSLAVIHNYQKEGRRVAVVTRPIVFLDAAHDDLPDRFLVVSRGYKTDFASLPALARLFYNPFDEYAEAAIIHDWLYAIGEEGKKREADLIFLRAMLDDGVSPVLARYFYTAVRLGGVIDNGFGRAEEWENGFYSVLIEDDLPLECIPDRPATAFLNASDIAPASTPETAEDYDRLNAMAAAFLQGYDPTLGLWQESLSTPGCQAYLGQGFRHRVGQNFEPLLADRPPEQADLIMVFSVLGESSDILQRKQIQRAYLEAFLASEYDLVLPDNFWCQNVTLQGRLLSNIMLSESGTFVMPELTCGGIADATATPPNRPAKPPTLDAK